MTTAAATPRFRTVGQHVARAIVLRAVAGGRMAGTLLIHGPPGAGKGAFLDDLLALLFCTGPPAARPCDQCRGCRDARARSHPDLLMASPERWRNERAGSESVVGAARRWLLSAAGSPLIGARRVIVIEQADTANEQIQNALLKVLEEPGERHMFVLVADDPLRLLPTIRSRAQPLRIGPVPRRELAEWLVDHERLPADQADALARLSAGLAGAALRLAREPELLAWRRRVQAELLSLLERGMAERFASARELVADAVRRGGLPGGGDAPEPDGERPVAGAGPQRAAALALVNAWLELARDLAVAAAGRAELSAAGELHEGLEEAARRVGPARATAFVRLLERIRVALGENVAPVLALDTAMLDWPHTARASMSA